MVTVILRGGLGNQMFQYAAGLNLAFEKNTELVLDTTFLNDRFPRRHFTYRTFALDVFDLQASSLPKVSFSTFSKYSSAISIPGFWLGLDLILAGIMKMFRGSDTVLWGFYQSESYFSEHADAVRRAFQFKNALSHEAAAIAEKIREANSVSLHVRRGDYAAHKKVQKEMGSTDLAYYEKAIEYILVHTSDPRFFIFSDDIEWCKQNLKLPPDSVYVDRSSEGPQASFHLELMSLCKHNIIANSTFSWWGAWLNRNPESIVIGPKRWHADGRQEAILPERWITI